MSDNRVFRMTCIFTEFNELIQSLVVMADVSEGKSENHSRSVPSSPV